MRSFKASNDQMPDAGVEPQALGKDLARAGPQACR